MVESATGPRAIATSNAGEIIRFSHRAIATAPGQWQMPAVAQRDTLSAELEYYREQEFELQRLHPGKFALIRDRKVVGLYSTALDAHAAGFGRFHYSPFLVKCITGRGANSSLTQQDIPKRPIERSPMEDHVRSLGVFGKPSNQH